MQGGGKMKPTEPMPVRIKIASILRREILAGEFAPGEELSLTDLGARFGVSRTPVREALQALASEGLIQLRMNRGAIVQKIDDKFIMDHFEIRALLESEAAARATKHLEQLLPMAQLHRSMLERISTVEQEEFVAYNQTFHMSLWEAADSQLLTHFLMDLWNGSSIGKTTDGGEHRVKALREHEEILQCIFLKEPEKAREAMRKHLLRSMENILASYHNQ